jgi:hypothetical protein
VLTIQISAFLIELNEQSGNQLKTPCYSIKGRYSALRIVLFLYVKDIFLNNLVVEFGHLRKNRDCEEMYLNYRGRFVQ